MRQADDGSPVLVGDGLVKTRRDFEQVFRLPSPTDRRFVAAAREFIAHKEDYCACACVRLGIGATLLSMGIEAFSYAMADDPQLIQDVHDAYADWTAAVVPVLEEIGFDVIWAFDDVAFNSGPMFSPAFYREHILPKERAVVATFTRPLITHSDGNMTPLLDAWLELGQQAIHPIQPDVMDIHFVKRQYGRRVALVGNIFMANLVHSTPTQIEAEVRDRIESVGAGGGYVISSSNSLTDNMKPENVLAMRDAIRKYGRRAARLLHRESTKESRYDPPDPRIRLPSARRLIFPRPFMVERGHHDGVAPDSWVEYEYAKIRYLYDTLGLGDRTEIEFFNGGHEIHGVGTFQFLHKHLNWPAPAIGKRE